MVGAPSNVRRKTFEKKRTVKGISTAGHARLMSKLLFVKRNMIFSDAEVRLLTHRVQLVCTGSCFFFVRVISPWLLSRWRDRQAIEMLFVASHTAIFASRLPIDVTKDA